jgi:hypothetical protein
MATWFAFMSFMAVCGVGIQLSVSLKKINAQLDLLQREIRELNNPTGRKPPVTG